jgi:hypothetical protein
MKVGTEVGIVTIRKIRRTRTGLIIRVFRGFKVRVRSSGESWSLKKTGLIIRGFKGFKVGVKINNMCVVIGL